MRLLFVADGRSPTTLNWISHFIQEGNDVHLVSTFPCEALAGLASLIVIPVAMSGLVNPAAPGGGGIGRLVRRMVPVKVRTQLRQALAPSSLPRAAQQLWGVIESVQPQVVHAMRIPYEGMLAAEAMKSSRMGHRTSGNHPLLVSVWGNDFTLHARSSRSMDKLTRETLQVADGLHTDCLRDQRLAVEMGFDAGKPAVMLPGGGGVQMDIFYPQADRDISSGPFTVINPRGVRAYVRNDTFFHAIPLVIEKNPGLRFICPGTLGERQVERWTTELGTGKSVLLLPRQSRAEMAELFRQSQMMVSITTHDGTPNTLLEGMACGCFPIVGDIESLREWITDGENGLLVDPADPYALANAIFRAIEQPDMRLEAGERNLQLVRERAEHGQVMRKAEEFYERLIEGGEELNHENK